MTGDPRRLVTRLGPASSTAWVVAMALLGALTLSACDDGGASGEGDRGPADAAADARGADAVSPDAAPPDAEPPDAESPDASPDVDAPDASPDAEPPDASPDAAPLPQAVVPAVTAGGATVESSRYRLRLAVGVPGPMHVTSSDRFQARIGAALPLPDTEERPR